MERASGAGGGASGWAAPPGLSDGREGGKSGKCGARSRDWLCGTGFVLQPLFPKFKSLLLLLKIYLCTITESFSSIELFFF